MNGDDKLLVTLYGKQDFKTVTFGFGENCDYRAENIRVVGMNTIFTLIGKNETEEIEIPTLGEHNVKNALAAFAVAKACGLSTDVIKAGLLTYKNCTLGMLGGSAMGTTLSNLAAKYAWIMAGLGAAGGMMRFVGFATLLRIMLSNEFWGISFSASSAVS